jgi:hypothetical protein
MLNILKFILILEVIRTLNIVLNTEFRAGINSKIFDL